MKRTLLFTYVLTFMFAFSALAQQTVTGTVTDDSGEGLPGVNVVIKGTTEGATTDLDGNFRLSVAGNETVLVFSFVGMDSQEITVGSRTVIDVSMASTVTELSELVVVGYGSQSKRFMTDNVAKINSEDISGVPIPSFQNALSGKAAGVRVTQQNGKVESGISVNIRGQASVSASSQPLFVLDGVPLINDNESQNTSAVNPLLSIPASDIESIDILKDASSAAIYGARGANGVVIITTKRGKEGKAQFSLNLSSGISRPTNKRDWLNAEQYIELFLEAGENNTAPWAGRAFVEGRFDRYSNGTWGTPDQYDTDWQEVAFQDGHVRDVDFSVSGGNNGSTYFLGASYNETKGIIRSNELERFSGRANLSQKINDKFTTGINFNFSRVTIDRVANDNAFTTPLQAIAQSPLSPTHFSAADFAADGESGPFTRTVYANFLLQDEFGSYETVVTRSIGKLYGQYEFTDWIKFNTDFAYDVFNQNEDQWNGSRVPFQSTEGEAFASNVLTTNYVWSNYATIDKTFDAHTLNVVLGTEYNQSNRRFTSVTGTNFPSDDLQTINSAATISEGEGSLTAYAFVGFFARAQYTFQDKYILKASVRRDGSSRFGSDSQYGTFPAVSVGWLLSEESFLDNLGALSFLKFRASYGELGNSEIGNFASRGLFQGSSYNQRPGLAPTQPGNNLLSWETSKQTDIGFEFGLFEGRLTGEIDYYKKDSEGLLFNVPLVPSSGPNNENNNLGTISRNIGDLENTGFEVLLNGDVVTGGDLSWNLGVNFAKNKNEAISIPDGNDIITGQNIIREGEALSSLYLIEYAGVDPANGDALYYTNTENADGSIDRSTTNDPNAADRIVAGSPVPEWIGGLTSSLRYKNFDFSFTFQGEWGASIYNGGGRFQSANADWFDNQTTDQLRRWQNPGDITDVPRAVLAGGNGTGHSTRWVQDADFIRLRNITLAYSLPGSLIQNTGLTSVRVYATAINLLTITDYDGYDPEARTDAAARTSNPSPGQTFYSAPAAKTFTLGINVKF
ncbi:MAG: TonB-dependent receptor [Cyclobacteriaceae bacterium]